jgi:hypothetical protein
MKTLHPHSFPRATAAETANKTEGLARSRTFEIRHFTNAPAADGESDFLGPKTVMTTARRFYGNKMWDKIAVESEQVTAAVESPVARASCPCENAIMGGTPMPGVWPFRQFPLGSPSACSAILLYGKQLHIMGSKEQINTKYCETKVFVKWPNSNHGRDAHATMISLPNQHEPVFFVAHMCALLGRNEITQTRARKTHESQSQPAAVAARSSE